MNCLKRILGIVLIALSWHMAQATVYYTGSFTMPEWDPQLPQEAEEADNCFYFAVSVGDILKISTTAAGPEYDPADYNKWTPFNNSLICPADNQTALTITTLANWTVRKDTSGNQGNISIGQDGVICISKDYAFIQLCARPEDFKLPVETKHYTIYFYSSPYEKPYLHLWDNEDQQYSSWGDDEELLKPTGKYYLIDGDYYPVWEYEVTSYRDFTHMLFHNVVGKLDEISDQTFENGGSYIYTPAGQDSDQNRELVSLPVSDEDDDVYVYLHTKYDLIRTGAPGAVPSAHVYNNRTGFAITEYDTDAELMEHVVVENHGKKGNTVDFTDKYTIWRFKVPKELVGLVNSVMFYFPSQKGGKARLDSRLLFEDSSLGNEGPEVNSFGNRNDHDLWSKYIYTTAAISQSGKVYLYAQQTFLSFDDFVKLDRECVRRGGRTDLFFTGDAEGMTEKLNEPLVRAENEEGCFYLKTRGSRKAFKVSWIEPIQYEYGDFDEQRYWSTFDLGIVAPSATGDGYVGSVSNGMLYFSGNKTVGYENYNQADWVLPESDSDFYVVVDSHEACHSVTVLFIDPHPELNLGYKSFRTVELTPEQAEALHEKSTHLNELATPGDTPKVARANVATGSVEIVGASNIDSPNHEMHYVMTAN